MYTPNNVAFSQLIKIYKKERNKRKETRISTNNTITIKQPNAIKQNKDFFSKWTIYLWIRAIVIHVNYHQNK